MGTTATGAQQTIAPGTSGHLLVSAGAAALAGFRAGTPADVGLSNVTNVAQVRTYATDCTASASQVVTHNLNTKDVTVSVYTVASTFDEVEVDVQHTSTTTCTIIFATAPTAAQYRIVVQG